MKNKNNFKQPEYLAKDFNCPHCFCYAQQQWLHREKNTYIGSDLGVIEKFYAPDAIGISKCIKCEEYAIWYNKKMVFPKNNSFIADAPDDLPENLKKYYLEAKLIASDSPRSALILIRFILEKFLQCIFKNDDKLDNNIKKIDDERLKNAIDCVRIIGNKTTHYELSTIFEDDIINIQSDLELICVVLKIAVEKYLTEQKNFDEVEKIKNKYLNSSFEEKKQK